MAVRYSVGYTKFDASELTHVRRNWRKKYDSDLVHRTREAGA